MSYTKLHRATVELPRHLASEDNPLQSRIVFFEVPIGAMPGQYLAHLLALAWNVHELNLFENDCVYNIFDERELIERAFPEVPNEFRIFETGYSDGKVTYVDQSDVDLFVKPNTASRIQDSFKKLAQINRG